mmetsp:Transcript_7116/g.13146  ORF Transcript_7116/g.13146 Transcript_7116/m.13146 type:complete len:127 (-) Transcript_7116:121-501(-)
MNVEKPSTLACAIETIRPGDSTHYPKRGDSVRVHYVGYLAGVKHSKKKEELVMFDSSRARDRPFTFTIGERQVIPGWEEAIPKLSRGQIARIHVPAVKAYGVTGYPPIIPSEADLIFEVELLSFSK